MQPVQFLPAIYEMARRGGCYVKKTCSCPGCPGDPPVARACLCLPGPGNRAFLLALQGRRCTHLTWGCLLLSHCRGWPYAITSQWRWSLQVVSTAMGCRWTVDEGRQLLLCSLGPILSSPLPCASCFLSFWLELGCEVMDCVLWEKFLAFLGEQVHCFTLYKSPIELIFILQTPLWENGFIEKSHTYL